MSRVTLASSWTAAAGWLPLLMLVSGVAAPSLSASAHGDPGDFVSASDVRDARGARAPQVAASGRVRMARLAVDLTGADSLIRVRVRYELLIPTTARHVPLRAIAFAGATFRNTTARVGEDETRIDLVRSSGSPLVTGTVPLHGDRSDSIFSFELQYEVLEHIFRGGDFDISVPVVLVDWPLEATRPGLFVASARMPVDYALVEVFPTVPLRHSSDSAAREYELDLQVVPSLVRFRGRLGTPPVVTFARVIDAAALAIILLGCFLGWRSLRSAG